MQKEIWKTIEECPNYSVSNLGRVCNNKSNRILSQKDCKTGYKMVGLMKEGKRYYRYVHRLVAIAFLDNPEGYKIVNHKDKHRDNNCVDNLEWCSPAYNTHHGLSKYTQLSLF